MYDKNLYQSSTIALYSQMGCTILCFIFKFNDHPMMCRGVQGMDVVTEYCG